MHKCKWTLVFGIVGPLILGTFLWLLNEAHASDIEREGLKNRVASMAENIAEIKAILERFEKREVAKKEK